MMCVQNLTNIKVLSGDAVAHTEQASSQFLYRKARILHFYQYSVISMFGNITLVCVSLYHNWPNLSLPGRFQNLNFAFREHICLQTLKNVEFSLNLFFSSLCSLQRGDMSAPFCWSRDRTKGPYNPPHLPPQHPAGAVSLTNISNHQIMAIFDQYNYSPKFDDNYQIEKLLLKIKAVKTTPYMANYSSYIFSMSHGFGSFCIAGQPQCIF